MKFHKKTIIRKRKLHTSTTIHNTPDFNRRKMPVDKLSKDGYNATPENIGQRQTLINTKYHFFSTERLKSVQGWSVSIPVTEHLTAPVLSVLDKVIHLNVWVTYIYIYICYRQKYGISEKHNGYTFIKHCDLLEMPSHNRMCNVRN